MWIQLSVGNRAYSNTTDLSLDLHLHTALHRMDAPPKNKEIVSNRDFADLIGVDPDRRLSECSCGELGN